MPVILFVCTANLFRSPMAAAIFCDHVLKSGHQNSWQVVSAGLVAPAGQPVPVLVQQAMLERGLDIGSHVCQAVTRELLEQSDLVLVMEKRQQEILRMHHPDLAERIALLSEMAGLSYDIADPNHNSLASIQATAKDIDSLLKRGMKDIAMRVDHA